MASRGVHLTTANFNFLTSSGTLSVALIRQGFGIGILPVDVGDADPELENPCSAFDPITIETWLVAHRELKTNPSIRLVFDLLAEGIRRQQFLATTFKFNRLDKRARHVVRVQPYGLVGFHF
jgi:DNA-binding transcriptional LysR family regulator